MATDKVYRCDRCGQDTPEGDGKHYKGDRFCPDCAEVVAFWETIEHDESETTCHYCEADCSQHWNLAPVGVLSDGSDYIYADGLRVCDDCYDGHCTKQNIQPLESEVTA